MTEVILHNQRKVWQDKPVTRCIYEDFYRRIILACKPGLTLEIGGGSGNLKEYIKDVISTDIVYTNWLDTAADAQSLPFLNECFSNIVLVDVLHHIEYPKYFLEEAVRVLKPGGRLILMEPAITPVSWFFYHFFHPEPVIMNVNPLATGSTDLDRMPFDANQAIPTVLFGRYRKHFEETFPLFKIEHHEMLSFFAYPLSGGFRPWSLVPSFAIKFILNIEKLLAPVIGRLMAFRIFIIIDKKTS